MFVDSVVIEDRTGGEGKAGNRFFYLYVKFFLELSGYKVLEDQKHELVSSDGCHFQRIIFVGADEEEREDGNIYLRVEEKIESQPQKIIEMLCEKLIIQDDAQGDLRRNARQYNKELFQELYTVCYLYASRYANYKGEDRLKEAARYLANKSSEKEKELSDEDHTWRDTYAYLYMTNRSNEGLYKLRTYRYRPYRILKERIAELKSMEAVDQNILLLEAEIFRNTEPSVRDHMSVYEKLQDASSYCTRFWARYAKAELLLEKADIRYREVYGDKDCGIRVKFNEPAMKAFESCLQMKTDEIRVVYKLALQDERKSLSLPDYREKALEKFEMIQREIELIPTAQRTTLEFEYLYKTRLRLGYLYMKKKNYDLAEAAYRSADGMWEHLEEYALFWKIYGDDTGDIIEILKTRHKNRRVTIDMYKTEIEILKSM